MPAKKKTNNPTTLSAGNFANVESVLQNHIRRLHEANNHTGANGEPVRGKDPWMGLMA